MPLVCYHDTTPYNINQDRADIILRTISDPAKRKIISCIKSEPKTVIQISKEIDLPVSTVYRKIGVLQEDKLLIASAGIHTIKNKKEFKYKSKIRKAVMVFEDDTLDFKVYSNMRD